MKIKLTIEVEMEEGYILHEDETEKMWLENEILVGDGNLLLHSNEVGETIGVIKKVTNLQYL